MNSEKNILSIRRQQIHKGIMGDNYVKGILVFLGAMITLTFVFQDAQLIGASLVVSLIHTLRSDKRLIVIAFNNPYRIYLIEYGLISIPFILLSFLFKNDMEYLISGVGILIIIILICSFAYTTQRLKPRRIYLNLNFLVFAGNYEWKAGLRNAGIGITILSIIEIILIENTDLPYMYLVYLSLLTLIIAKFYTENEPVLFLENRAKKSQTLLCKSVFLHVTALGVLILPITLFQIFKFHTNRDLLICFWGLFSTIICLLFWIVTKYAYYAPNRNNLLSQLMIFVSGSSIIMPLVIAIPLTMLFRNYGKAIKNLNFYLT